MNIFKEFTIVSDHGPAAQLLEGWLVRLGGMPLHHGGYPIHIALNGKQGEGYRLRADSSGARLTAQSSRGAMYGVYALLEQAFGCRFLAPDCVVLPEQPVRVNPLDVASAPAFSYRELFWRGALDPDFVMAQGLNATRGQLPEALADTPKFYNYSHSFEELISPKEYFDEHPEYFSLVDGARRGEQSQLCLTNPRVLRIVVEKVRDWMRSHPDKQIFSVSMNDWYSPCQCPDCAAVDSKEGSQAGSLLHFVNRVADAIREEFPANYIHTFAYLYGRQPPRFVKARDNVIVRLAPIERCFSHGLGQCRAEVEKIDVKTTSVSPFYEGGRFYQQLEGWAKACEQLYIWDYSCNYAHYLLPFPNLFGLQDTLRHYRSQGVKGVFIQGNYSPGQSSGFSQLKIYAMARLLWDPDTDLPRLIERFVKGYYGEAAAPMVLQYLRLAQQAVQHHHMSLYDDPDAPYFSPQWLRPGLRLLEDALKATGDPDRRRRLELELLSPRYALLTALPMDSPGRDAAMDAFAADCRRLGISELFERRELEASFACLKHSPYARDRSRVPYHVYRL